MATLATATEKKAHMSADEKPERKPHRGRVDDKFKIFCGTANESLCDEVCAFLGLTRGQAVVTRFSDGEAYVQIQENVRGADVFAMQPTCRPVDEHLMELLLMIDALKRASARRITAVIPYYGYARQDRNDRPRAPIACKLVKAASALKEYGACVVYACASHAVLSGAAVENVAKSCITEVVVTNTIPLNDGASKEPKFKVLSIAGLIGRAIQSIHEETSVSGLST